VLTYTNILPNQTVSVRQKDCATKENKVLNGLVHIIFYKQYVKIELTFYVYIYLWVGAMLQNNIKKRSVLLWERMILSF
jgi:hypothetical protein